ncbi:FAD-dependent oxidoreductase [Pelagibius litoralis]|uniref:FAD-dependent oxidoreductase n=1 Tax=Pelagibius litoralis TaxID=374515 RepID=A0A967C5Q3_9PROT|nr:FAD-dependent oxidoreductase [Pelagibius litoralis]NIA67002.1 FAD-dependent oxidoreductase [Pelagibius litoralis]
MSDDLNETGPIVVVGAGIVGVCCALYLLRDGHQVTLLDRGAPGEGTSFGNGSIITEEAVVPVQTPGIARKVPGMLMDPLGPLAIRWRYLPKLAPWLLQFVRASSPDRVEEVSIALQALLSGARTAYDPLVGMGGLQDMIQRSGWLSVYETEAGFQSYEPLLELQRRRGVEFDVLPAEELRQLEPSLAPIFERGVFYPNVSHTVDNFRFVQELATTFARSGGQIRRERVVGFDQVEGSVTAVLTEAGRVDCRAVVIAAGAWSKNLTAMLGSRPPLDTERGYHLTLPHPGVSPRLPIYSTERGFVCTPLEQGLRIAGTVELGGLNAAPNWRRAEVLYENANRWFPGLDRREETRWMGFRPSMPDSLPVIGPAPHHKNALFAFGHGHCGLSLAARTGALIAALVEGRDPGVDMAPYRADRF